MTTILLIGLTVIATPQTTAPRCATENTIPALIERLRPAPVERHIIRELIPMSVEGLAAEADLVVDADVHPVNTYVSTDGCYLLTDFEVRPREVLAGRIPSVRVPGVQKIIVTMTGGTKVIDGVTVITRDENLPLLEPGRRVILFLKRSAPQSEKFELVGSVSGAFDVLPEGTVKPMVRGGSDAYLASLPAQRDAFIDLVRAKYRPR